MGRFWGGNRFWLLGAACCSVGAPHIAFAQDSATIIPPQPPPIITRPTPPIAPNEPHHEALLDFPIAWPTNGIDTPLPSGFTAPVQNLAPHEVYDVIVPLLRYLNRPNEGLSQTQIELARIPSEWLEGYHSLREAYVISFRTMLRHLRLEAPILPGNSSQYQILLRNLRTLQRHSPELAAPLFRDLRDRAVAGRGSREEILISLEASILLAEQTQRAGRDATTDQVNDLTVHRRLLEERILPTLRNDNAPQTGRALRLRTNLRQLVTTRIYPNRGVLPPSLATAIQEVVTTTRHPFEPSTNGAVERWINRLVAAEQSGQALTPDQFVNLLSDLVVSYQGGPPLVDRALDARLSTPLTAQLQRGIRILRAQMRSNPTGLRPTLATLGPRLQGPDLPFHVQQILATVAAAGPPSLVHDDHLWGTSAPDQTRPITEPGLSYLMSYAGYRLPPSFSIPEEPNALSGPLEQRFAIRYHALGESMFFQTFSQTIDQRVAPPALLRAIETDLSRLTDVAAGTLEGRDSYGTLLRALTPENMAQLPLLTDRVIRFLSSPDGPAYLGDLSPILQRLIPYLPPDLQVPAYEAVLRNSPPPMERLAPGRSGVEVVPYGNDVAVAIAEVLAEATRAHRTRPNARATPVATTQRGSERNRRAQRQAAVREIEVRYQLLQPGASTERDYPIRRQAANHEIARLENLDEPAPSRRTNPQPAVDPEALRQTALNTLRQQMADRFERRTAGLMSLLGNDPTNFEGEFGDASFYERLQTLQTLLRQTARSPIEAEHLLDRAIAEWSALTERTAAPGPLNRDFYLHSRILLEQVVPIRLALHRTQFSLANLQRTLTTLEQPITTDTWRAERSNFEARTGGNESRQRTLINYHREHLQELLQNTPAESVSITPTTSPSTTRRPEETRRMQGAQDSSASTNRVTSDNPSSPTSRHPTTQLRHHTTLRRQFFTRVGLNELPTRNQTSTVLEVLRRPLPDLSPLPFRRNIRSEPLLTPTPTPEIPHGFVALATPIDGTTGEALSITHLAVTDAQGQPLRAGVDYEVVDIGSRPDTAHEGGIQPLQRRGYGLRFLRDHPQGIRYHAQFGAAQRTATSPRPVDAPVLPPTAVQQISQELRQEGFTRIADSFERLTRQQRPLTIDELARAFSSVSVYSLTPENPAENTTTRFGRFRGFLGLENNPGVLCAICNGGNSLFPEILNAVFENAHMPFSATSISGFSPDIARSSSRSNQAHRITRVVHTPTGYTVGVPDATPDVISRQNPEQMRNLMQREPRLTNVLRSVRAAIRSTPRSARSAVLALVHRGRNQLAAELLRRAPTPLQGQVGLRAQDHAALGQQGLQSVEETLAAYDQLVEAESLPLPNVEEAPTPTRSIANEAAPNPPRTFVLDALQNQTLQTVRAAPQNHERALLYRNAQGSADREVDPEALIRDLSNAIERAHTSEGETQRAALREVVTLYARLRLRIQTFLDPAQRTRLQVRHGHIFNFYNIENAAPNRALQRVLDRAQSLETILLEHRSVLQNVLTENTEAFTDYRRHLTALEHTGTETNPHTITATAERLRTRRGRNTVRAECMIQAVGAL